MSATETHIFDGDFGAAHETHFAHDLVDIRPKLRAFSEHRCCLSQSRA